MQKEAELCAGIVYPPVAGQLPGFPATAKPTVLLELVLLIKVKQELNMVVVMELNSMA